MKIMVTGCSGFIGSHLVDALLDEGHQVVGVDSLTPYYDPKIKRANLQERKGLVIFRENLGYGVTEGLAGVDVVVHLAAQAGVRSSFDSFEDYTWNNMVATQQLLEDMQEMKVRRLVFASSSSVYGDTAGGPIAVDHPLRPISPYGVTKVGTENLVQAYGRRGLQAIGLRYFTVFGPRQRPDMAFSKFFKAMVGNEMFPLYGRGQMFRDYTYVSDVVTATIQAINRVVYEIVGEDSPYEVFNVGGGNVASGNQVVETLAEITGLTPRPHLVPVPQGDVWYTRANIGLTQDVLGFEPQVDLKEGLTRQWDWLQSV